MRITPATEPSATIAAPSGFQRAQRNGSHLSRAARHTTHSCKRLRRRRGKPGQGLIVVCCKPLVNERTQERLAPYKCRVTWKNKLEFLIAARRAKSLTDTQ